MSLYTIGLLNACTPAEEVEFNASEVETFRRFLDLVPNQLKLVEYRITEGEFPASPAACDAFWITGSPRGVYDENPWISQLGDFIRDAYKAGKKLIGICFGHQILAHALGGHAEKSEKGWGMGRREVTLYDTPEWMQPPLAEKSLYFCHQDQVTRLPEGATHLGGNSFCPNAMFALGDQVLAMQAHPEFSADLMSYTVNYLAPSLDPGFVSEVQGTIDHPTDSEVIARWIVNFLNSERPTQTVYPQIEWSSQNAS